MTGDMRIDRYEWRGGSETMLRFGPADGPQVIAALPLFEEANRTRAAMVDVLRRLAAKGIGGVVPDLPGTGESTVATADARLADWRAAFASAGAALDRPYVVAWRGGALVDAGAEAAGRWHLSPVEGMRVVTELRRIRSTAGSKDYAGNVIADALIDQLAAASPAAGARTVRLASDPAPADRHIDGPALWRGIEPGVNVGLQQAIADDIADWIARCEG